METGEIIGLSFVGLTVIVVLLVVGAAIGGFGFPYAGEHTGYITVVERGGMLNIPLLYLKTDNQSSQEDKYCLVEGLVDEAKQLSQSRQLVTVKFERGFWMPFWRCNGGEVRVTNIVKN